MFKKPVVFVTLAAILIVPLCCYVQILGSENAIMDLHPEIDSHIIRKAHRRFFFDLVRSHRNGAELDFDNEAEIDAYFMKNYVNPLIKK